MTRFQILKSFAFGPKVAPKIDQGSSNMVASNSAVLVCGTRPDIRWWSYLANAAFMPIAQLFVWEGYQKLRSLIERLGVAMVPLVDLAAVD